MTVPVFSRKIQMQFLSSRSRRIFPLSSSYSLSSTIHQSTRAAVGSRSYSQHNSYHRSYNDAPTGNYFWGMASVAATAGISFLGISSSSSQTFCESNPGMNTDSSGTSQTNPVEDLEVKPEIDPYDNLPEKDEPTHCSICLTYRKGPCRPYWRKVEACTKDGEKESKKKDEEGTVSEDDDNNKDDNDSSSPMSESTRCFKYMMPWIDCASKYRNLYTLIEMDTNYTEGIEELEATSRHFCWVPGREPKIDWSNWQQSGTEEEEEKQQQQQEINSNATKDADADVDVTDLVSNVALWKTLDPALGDPKLITVEAEVPVTINSGLGVLECAYAVDQDNNVIGFVYGTKPSDLIEDENQKVEEDNTKAVESDDDDEKEKKGTDIDHAVQNENKDKMVTLSIKLVASRTQDFVLSASYTHRIVGGKSSSESGNNPIALESQLYKSKPFALADVPKLTPALSPLQESGDNHADPSPQVSP